LSDTLAERTVALVPPTPALPGRCQITVSPAVTSVFAAVWAAETDEVVIVPSLSYRSLITGQRKVQPFSRWPFTMVVVPHLIRYPVPAAYDADTPPPDTVPPAPPFQPPVRVPVASSNSSPSVGKENVTPVGN
jgi:hypothetical protein